MRLFAARAGFDPGANSQTAMEIRVIAEMSENFTVLASLDSIFHDVHARQKLRDDEIAARQTKLFSFCGLSLSGLG